MHHGLVFIVPQRRCPAGHQPHELEKILQQCPQMSTHQALQTELSPLARPGNSSPRAILSELHGLPVNGLNDSYMFKVDDAEFSRLDVHHSMFSAGLDGLFPAPAREDIQHALQIRDDHPKPAILDIGTGSGAWCIEMARAFPNAYVVGMDLVPVKASSLPPSNCHFEVGNADTDLTKMYPAESFDLVHARTMMQGVKDFPSFFQNVSRMLRPGGVLLIMDGRFVTWDEERQLIEYKEEGQPGFSWFRKMIYHMHEALEAHNPNTHLMYRITDCVRGMGDEVWKKVDSFDLYLPVGDLDSATISPGQRLGGRLFAQSLSMLPDSIRPMLLSSSLKPEEVDRLTIELRAELKEPKVKQFSQFIYTWAVKK